MQEIKEYVKLKKEELKNSLQHMRKYTLAIVQVGDNPASNSYVRGKIKDCDEVGLKHKLCKLDENITQNQLDDCIKELNLSNEIDGIIVQLPLPKHLSVNLSLIDKNKDVDGFRKDSYFTPCTPLGIINFFQDNDVSLDGINAVVIGRSDIVGKPMAKLLMEKNATVTICHSHTKDISIYTKTADLIIVATGKINTLTADMIGDNMPIIIDVGINRKDGKLCGDCDYENLKEKCSYISPVPGGVGLLTRLTLLKNTTRL